MLTLFYVTHRYLRALAAFYIRLTFRPVEVYETLEPLLRDFRKIRYRDECTFSTLASSAAPFSALADLSEMTEREKRD